MSKNRRRRLQDTVWVENTPLGLRVTFTAAVILTPMLIALTIALVPQRGPSGGGAVAAAVFGCCFSLIFMLIAPLMFGNFQRLVLTTDDYGDPILIRARHSFFIPGKSTTFRLNKYYWVEMSLVRPVKRIDVDSMRSNPLMMITHLFFFRGLFLALRLADAAASSADNKDVGWVLRLNTEFEKGGKIFFRSNQTQLRHVRDTLKSVTHLRGSAKSPA